MITLENLDFSYSAKRPLFAGLELEIGEGRIFGLLGRNGEGKSTLLKLISGMLFPQSGSIECMGVNPLQREPSFMSNIYYIPEDIFSPNETLRNYEKLYSPFYPQFSHSDFVNYTEEFQLDSKQKISSMSLGQKKKAAIAFGLACNTKLLIMDEPTNGLDIPSKSQFRKIVSQLLTKERTIIISTHQVRDLDNLIESLIILDNNRILLNNTIEEVSQRLCFRKLTDGEEAIYEESSVMGHWGVVPNDSGEESRVDIEMLFNAAISQPEKIMYQLNG